MFMFASGIPHVTVCVCVCVSMRYELANAGALIIARDM